MNPKILTALLCCALILLSSTACTQEPARLPAGEPTSVPSGEGWIDLFSAENAPYWKNVTDKADDIFSIADGIFHIKGKKPTRYIAWEHETFGNFEMHIEFKAPKNANSGVFVRTSPADPVQKGMEIQVMGDFGEAPSIHGSGALYDIATPMFNMARPEGEWNSLDIRFEGSSLDVIYNGWKVLSLDVSQMTMPIGKFDTPLASLPTEGHIILQNHGDDVWYRNHWIRRL